MTKIAATEQRTFQLSVPPETAYAFFARPLQFRQAMEGVERCEVLPGGVVHWTLEEKVDSGIRFQPDYVVVFEGDGRSLVRWSFVEGNMGNEGSVRVEPEESGGCIVHYEETVEPNLPITGLMAKLIKPIVTRELKKDLSGFLDRAKQCMESATATSKVA